MSFSIELIKPSGYRYLGGKLIAGLSLFNGATEGDAETARDAFFDGNTVYRDAMDNDGALIIVLSYGSPLTTVINSRVSGEWVNTFSTATAGVNLGAHSVTELNDVTDAGSGLIMTAQERTDLSNAMTNTLAEDFIWKGDGSNEAEAVALSSIVLPVAVDVHNASGATIVKGRAVYVSGTHASGKPQIDLAANTAESTMPAFGLVADDIDDGQDGTVITSGTVTALNTGAYSAGDVLYVSTAGGLTATRPTGTTLLQSVCIVGRSHASSGSLIVVGAGRANDLPNLGEGKVFVGTSTGEAVQADKSFTVDNTSHTTDFTAAWNYTYGNVDNTAGTIVVTLPDATASNEGDEIKFWILGNPANYQVLFTTHDTDGTINGLGNDGAEKAKGQLSSSKPTYTRVTVQCMGLDDYHISNIDTVYNTLRYVVSFDKTNDFSPYSYLQLSAIPTDFMTNNADWWFACKLEQAMTNDSDSQVLFGSNNFFASIRGNGTYWSTSSTSGYLQTMSPNTIPTAGEWIIYRYDSVNDEYTAYVNGTKVLNATTSGATPPSTAPTDMWFGSEEGQVSPPSGYGYPLQQCKVQSIVLGSTLPTDAECDLFTSTQFGSPSLTTGVVTNEWSGGASSMTTVTGAINLTAVGADISFEEI